MSGINHLLQHTISVQNPGSTRDKSGRVSLGSASNIKSRFQRRYKTIVTAERDKEPIHAEIWVGAGDTIERGAKVTYQSEEYRVMEVSGIPLGNGKIHHYEALLQLWSYA